MAGISRESFPPLSAILKCLIYAFLENRSYGKALSKLPYLSNVSFSLLLLFIIINVIISLLLFINLDHFFNY